MTHLADTIAATESKDPVELSSLSKSPDLIIRAYVAENIHTPIETLEILCNDKEPMVHIYLLRNRNLPVKLFLQLLKTVKDPLAKREACYSAVVKYKTGELSLTHEELLDLVKILDKKVDTLTLIEAVENLHFLHDKSKCK